jgi:uncharacterized protein
MIIRSIFNRMKEEFTTGKRIIGIYGMRRTGKTVLSKQLLETWQGRTCFITFDDYPLQVRAQRDPGYFRTHLEGLLGCTTDKLKEQIAVVVDEFQKVPGIAETVKLLYDQGVPIKWILSGSSSLQLGKRFAESLAGRIRLFHIDPFNAAEALALRGVRVNDIPFWEPFVNGTLDHAAAVRIAEETRWLSAPWADLVQAAVMFGTLPEVLQEPTDQARRDYLIDYRRTYIEQDVRDLETVGNLLGFESLMSMVAATAGQCFNRAAAAQAAGVDARTAVRYLGVLRETCVIHMLPSYAANISKRVAKAPKVIVADNGLLAAYTDEWDPARLKLSGRWGNAFENWAVGEFIKKAGRRNDWNLYYYRAYSGAETDLVIAGPHGPVPVEVKWGDKTATRGLRSFQAYAVTAPPAAALLYDGPVRDLGNGILALPHYMLALE